MNSRNPLISVLAIFCVLSIAGAHVSRSTGRALLTEQEVAGCVFAGNKCYLSPQVALSVAATDDKARLAQKVAAMDYTCSKITNSTECGNNDNCTYTGLDGRCMIDPDHIEWESFLACPGSQAAAAIKCMAAQSETSCTGVTACSWKVPTEQEVADILKKVLGDAFSAAAAAISKGRTTDDASTLPDAFCMPKDMALVDFFNQTMVAMSSEAYDYPTAYWGSCVGVDLLRAFSTVCNNLTETACKAKSVCYYGNSGCRIADDGKLALLLTSSSESGDLDKKVEAVAAECAKATNATECGTFGTAQKVKIDDAKINDALNYQQPVKSAASGVAAAVHFVLACIAGLVMLMA